MGDLPLLAAHALALGGGVVVATFKIRRSNCKVHTQAKESHLVVIVHK